MFTGRSAADSAIPVYQYLTKIFSFIGRSGCKENFTTWGEFPVARPTTEEKFISGELYTINNPNEFSWAIGQLDDYEGLNAEEGETPPYKREEVIAYQDGKPVTAWIYWFNGNVEANLKAESGDLLQYLQQKNKP